MSSTTETFLRMEAIFHEALESPKAERKRLIAERCGGDVAMQEEVFSLLHASELETQVTATRRLQPETGFPGSERQRVGPYLIDRLLGRGGMGAVYLAHRVDGQFDQQVAIKLIDLPLATDLFRERFRLERQILANLQHPLIARLLDGGVTEDGELYLAMEYVDGIPIHRFCDQNQLTIQQRVRLFRHVCDAVQYAHQSLVVHRDLKPDNILVAEDGSPRLLDFGTAKLVSPSVELSGGEITREGYQSFTPQYASPEQVLGNPISTASDTYSLGVLLYRLLTGSVPYELKELSTAEMVRVICQEPPRRPVVQIPGMPERLDADLEAILSKALRKEPQERYQTAEQLSTDLLYFLQGRPVEARRGTLRYKTVKFIRRNRLRLAGAAALALTLAAGVAGVVWQATVANEQRRKAEARSADLRQLSNSLLSELDEAIKELPGSTGAQKLLVTRVLEHLDRMAADARKDVQVDRQTALDLIDAYTRLGNLQGNGYDQNLGDHVGGLVSLNKAQALAQPLVAALPRDQDALRALATVEQSRSEILYQEGKTVEAVAAMLEAVKRFDALIADPRTPVALLGEVASAYGSLGDQLGAPGTPSLGDRVGAIEWYRKTIDLDRRALALDPSFLRAQRGLALMQMKLGQVEVAFDPAKALEDDQAALRQLDSLPPAQQTSLFTTRMRTMVLRKEANVLSAMEDSAAALPILEQVIAGQRKVANADPQDVRAQYDVEIDLTDRASVYKDAADPRTASGAALDGAGRMEKLRAALSDYQQGAAILEKTLRSDDENMRSEFAQVLVQIGAIQAELPGEAVSEARTARGLAMLRELAAKPDASPAVLDGAAGGFMEAQPVRLRDPKFALDCAQREVAATHRKSSEYLLTLAEAYRAVGEPEQARAAAREGLALIPESSVRGTRMVVRDRLEYESRK